MQQFSNLGLAWNPVSKEILERSQKPLIVKSGLLGWQAWEPICPVSRPFQEAPPWPQPSETMVWKHWNLPTPGKG